MLWTRTIAGCVVRMAWALRSIHRRLSESVSRTPPPAAAAGASGSESCGGCAETGSAGVVTTAEGETMAGGLRSVTERCRFGAAPSVVASVGGAAEGGAAEGGAAEGGAREGGSITVVGASSSGAVEARRRF